MEPPTTERLDRLIGSALHTTETAFRTQIVARLSAATRDHLDALLTLETVTTGANDHLQSTTRAPIQILKADAGPLRVETAQQEVAKLRRLRELQLPTALGDGIPAALLHDYRQRVLAEEPFELRRHPDPLRLALLAAFCHLRSQEITDTLVDLLSKMIHHVGIRAERKVTTVLVQEIQRVANKYGILRTLAKALLDQPQGVIEEVIFPLVDQDTLRDVLAELSREGSTYRERVQRTMHRSYGGHYRRMVAPILELLTFRSHNIRHQPIMQALELFTRYATSDAPYYDRDEEVPLDGVVPAAWRDAVIASRQRGPDRIRRVPYEICVLQALREKLRCKEIWVVGANRYRDPDQDVPQDFADQRVRYYQALQLPLDADTFIQTMQQEHAAALELLNAGLPTNRDVRILDKDKGWIEVSPLTAQPEPPNLTALKQAVNGGWMLTGLLDMLKETALLTGFLKVFTSVTDHERMDRATLEQRLLLCLYGLGTNTGLRRMSVGNPGVSEKDLRYIRRRFITTDHLRNAIACVVNAILDSRLPDIWGEATTACASDSKKFGAWDQNLITEWHTRYRGRGVVIYWHVEKKAACFHSQLKTCASSEVAAAMTGVIHHCTAMAVDKHYVDSHGQSEVAFGFCRLLGYHLLPRLKPIHSQKLSLPTREHATRYPHLQHILTRPIDWELIRQQYDEMVKYASALQQGTAEAEAILARFTRNAGHPTYKSTAELGRVEKTIFLCHYLHSEALRREINEGLNVVENCPPIAGKIKKWPCCAYISCKSRWCISTP